MSWVKVKQGNVELLIPHQAFKDVYEKNGFVLVEEPKAPTHKSLEKTDIKETEPKEVVENGKVQPKGNRPNKNNNTRKV